MVVVVQDPWSSLTQWQRISLTRLAVFFIFCSFQTVFFFFSFLSLYLRVKITLVIWKKKQRNNNNNNEDRVKDTRLSTARHLESKNNKVFFTLKLVLKHFSAFTPSNIFLSLCEVAKCITMWKARSRKTRYLYNSIFLLVVRLVDCNFILSLFPSTREIHNIHYTSHHRCSERE